MISETTIEVPDGIGTTHFETTRLYADGRIEKTQSPSIEPIWNKW